MKHVALRRLSYRVVACTSEHALHPKSELSSNQLESLGWQSEKFCHYPQELVLQLHGHQTIQTVEMRSHQIMIASRAEIYIGAQFAASPMVYRHLGDCRFESNGRRAHAMCEVKTLHLPAGTKGTHLKIVLHRCHADDVQNLYNQVGLAAVTLYSHAGRRQSSSQQPSATRDMDLDVLSLVWAAREGRRQAEAVEDYDEAKRLHVRIQSLQRLGAHLFEQESQKTALLAQDHVDSFGRLRMLQDSLTAVRAAHSIPVPPSGHAPITWLQPYRPIMDLVTQHPRKPWEPPPASRSELEAAGARAKLNVMAAHYRLPHMPYSDRLHASPGP